MGTFANVEEAREFFQGDRFAVRSGIMLDALEEDCARCSVTIDDDLHRTAAGGVMGGVLFTLADFAFAAATNNMHRITVALDVHIHFLAGTRGTRLFAETRCIKDGKTTCVYDVDVTDDTGRLVAKFVGTGYKL